MRQKEFLAHFFRNYTTIVSRRGRKLPSSLNVFPVVSVMIKLTVGIPALIYYCLKNIQLLNLWFRLS